MESSSELENLGGSLPVPSVQELVKRPLVAVPPRYVRPDQDPPAAIYPGTGSTSLPTVPIIDMQRLLLEDRSLELEKLHTACKDWGFFQLVNHGVSSSLIEKMKSETRNLFGLTLEEKKRYWQEAGNLNGFGQVFIVSEEQKLDWADVFFLVNLSTHQRNHSLFEKLPPSYRETLEDYITEMRNLALTLLGLMARALEMDVEEMRMLFEDGYQSMRSNYYPPCPQPELVTGIAPHSDAGGLTVLLQVNEAQGLEIRKDGRWVPVQPLPNALVVNIGDMLEIITNGAYRSILHRATVNSVQERLSIATFFGPNLKAEIGPSPSLISLQNPPLYRRITVQQYLRDFFARELKAKSLIETLKERAG